MFRTLRPIWSCYCTPIVLQKKENRLHKRNQLGPFYHYWTLTKRNRYRAWALAQLLRWIAITFARRFIAAGRTDRFYQITNGNGSQFGEIAAASRQISSIKTLAFEPFLNRLQLTGSATHHPCRPRTNIRALLWLCRIDIQSWTWFAFVFLRNVFLQVVRIIEHHFSRSFRQFIEWISRGAQWWWFRLCIVGVLAESRFEGIRFS